jgi:hypothetical protein
MGSEREKLYKNLQIYSEIERFDLILFDFFNIEMGLLNSRKTNQI